MIVMSNAVVVDASVWVSWLSRHDANHHASYRWMERYTTTKGILIAPTILLVEVAAAMSRSTGQKVIAKEAIKSLTSMGEMHLVPLDFSMIQTAADGATELQLRAGDATYVAVAYEHGVSLISWDREQLERGKRIITTYSPITYPF